VLDTEAADGLNPWIEKQSSDSRNRYRLGTVISGRASPKLTKEPRTAQHDYGKDGRSREHFSRARI
jgi:hypothetical protein